MPKFGRASMLRIMSCHADLQMVCDELIKYTDFTVVSGHRTKEEQNALYPAYSKVKFPFSKHNSYPSKAVDIAPWKPALGHIDWEDELSFIVLAGRFLQVADELGVNVRWGGNWDCDDDIEGDQQFYDWGHFELVDDDG